MKGLERSRPPPSAVAAQTPAARRDRIARIVALATIVSLGIAFSLSAGTRFLMPGPLTGAHASIETCSSCHAHSGDGKVSWLKGLAGGSPHADSKACLACHTIPGNAFNAHGTAEEDLKRRAERLTRTATSMSPPLSARAQSFTFPTNQMVAAGLQCAACHQEHRGPSFDLKAVSDEKCRSCHIVKFDRFDNQHPVFETYPFERRTRLIYDHASHFGKHFPEIAKKSPAKTIPATCATCHDVKADRRIMGVAAFDKTCRSCHLDQITGKERASGPKGVSFLALPGIDVASLKSKNASIGEWPEDSDAVLTPFMKVMIGRSEPGRATLDGVERLNLQDLGSATGPEIKAVENLIWEIKSLISQLISGEADAIFAALDFSGRREAAANSVADLTANLPRDVLVSAQRQWLPNLVKEMASRSDARERQRSNLNTRNRTVTRLAMVEALTRSDASPLRFAAERPAGWAEMAGGDGQGLDQIKRRSLPSGTPRAIRGETVETDRPPNSPKESTGAGVIPSLDDPIFLPADSGATDGGPATALSGDPADQSDELLKPTDAELKEIKAREKGAFREPAGGGSGSANLAQDRAASGAAGSSSNAGSQSATPELRSTGAPTADAGDGDVNAEEWADAGGWYRQDYAIYYRPTGHKDRFIVSWLQMTGPGAPRGDKGPASAVFDFLTGKDAQGSCTKCHSVDDVPGMGRAVNFAPPTAQNKAGQFTRFSHEPHFGLMEDRGCLGCHALEKHRSPLKSYEQGDPRQFVSNFGAVKKEVCQSCHATGMARQDCSVCHTYHVNGVGTAIMKTKISPP